MNTGEPTDKEKLSKFYNDLSIYISKKNNNVNKKYINLFEKLEELYNILDENEDDAIEEFLKLDCSRYNSLKNYIMNTEKKFKTSTKFTTESTKSLRSKRNIIKCPNCNISLSYSSDGIYGCPKCQYEAPKQYITPNTKININNTKHIIKQLDMLCGQKKLSNNISKIIKYIVIWLTDLKWIHEWLKSKGTFKKFLINFNQYNNFPVSEEYFDSTIERIPQNKWNSKIYKLFMDEFFMLTEISRRILKINDSIINNSKRNEILNIIDEWIKQNKDNLYIPNQTDNILYNGNNYNIGNYFANISIHPSYKNDEFFNYC